MGQYEQIIGMALVISREKSGIRITVCGLFSNPNEEYLGIYKVTPSSPTSYRGK